MSGAERREVQRLRLSKPILAQIRGSNALMLDVGMGGAFLEHYGTADLGERFNLTFRWKGEDVELASQVVRTTVVRNPGGDGASSVSHTGVRFIEPHGEVLAKLQDLITTFVSRILAAQKANASGDDQGESAGATILAMLGEARRMRSRGFTSYHLRDDTWWRTPTESPKQPPDGFTVGTFEDEDEVEELCRTYEGADEEGRNLIRLVAELSVRQEQ